MQILVSRRAAQGAVIGRRLKRLRSVRSVAFTAASPRSRARTGQLPSSSCCRWRTQRRIASPAAGQCGCPSSPGTKSVRQDLSMVLWKLGLLVTAPWLSRGLRTGTYPDVQQWQYCTLLMLCGTDNRCTQHWHSLLKHILTGCHCIEGWRTQPSVRLLRLYAYIQQAGSGGCCEGGSGPGGRLVLGHCTRAAPARPTEGAPAERCRPLNCMWNRRRG